MSVSGIVAPGTAKGIVSERLLVEEPELARFVVTAGRRRRAGHRGSYAGIDWSRYRAHVGIGQQRGPWQVEMAKASDVDAWIAEAEGLPHEPGWYTCLVHEDRGLVMSDLPAEIAGALDFMERAAGRVLVSGLGLGIVPAYLLAHRPVESVDVVEYDPDVVELVTAGADEDGAPNAWAADPRLYIHHGDAHAFRFPPGTRWTCAWHDIWDRVAADNLPSMRLLRRRYAGRTGWQVCWEEVECLAQRDRERRRVLHGDPYGEEMGECLR